MNQTKDSSVFLNKPVSYIIYLSLLKIKDQCEPSFIIATDETSVWAHLVLDTVERLRKKDILMKTAGHKNIRVTICLAAKGDKTKMKPFTVFSVAKHE